MSDLTSKTSSKLKGLGIYQIAGGGVGVLLILWALLNSQQVTGLVMLIYFFMLLFFSFSIYCGIFCVRRDDNALRISLINQLLQLIGLAMFGFAFQYAAGIYLTAGVDLSDSFNFKFGAGISKFDLNVNNEAQRLELHFNFIALALIVFIEKLKKQINEENDKEISSIVAT